MVNHNRPQSGMFDSRGTGHPPREVFLPAHRECAPTMNQAEVGNAPDVPVRQATDDLPTPIERVSE